MGVRVGVVDRLWRYPVKSMVGEALAEVEVSENGLAGDRTYAVLDVRMGRVVSAKNPKRWPGLFHLRASYVTPPTTGDPLPAVRITFPDGDEVESGDSQADARRPKRLPRGARAPPPPLPSQHPAGARRPAWFCRTVVDRADPQDWLDPHPSHGAMRSVRNDHAPARGPPRRPGDPRDGRGALRRGRGGQGRCRARGRTGPWSPGVPRMSEIPLSARRHGGGGWRRPSSASVPDRARGAAARRSTSAWMAPRSAGTASGLGSRNTTRRTCNPGPRSTSRTGPGKPSARGLRSPSCIHTGGTRSCSGSPARVLRRRRRSPPSVRRAGTPPRGTIRFGGHEGFSQKRTMLRTFRSPLAVIATLPICPSTPARTSTSTSSCACSLPRPSSKP